MYGQVQLHALIASFTMFSTVFKTYKRAFSLKRSSHYYNNYYYCCSLCYSSELAF